MPIYLIVAFSCWLCLVALPVLAGTQTEAWDGVVDAPSGLFLRDRGTVDGSKIALLPRGTSVRVLHASTDHMHVAGAAGRWVYVETPRGRGFMFDAWLAPATLADRLRTGVFARTGFPRRLLFLPGGQVEMTGFHNTAPVPGSWTCAGGVARIEWNPAMIGPRPGLDRPIEDPTWVGEFQECASDPRASHELVLRNQAGTQRLVLCDYARLPASGRSMVFEGTRCRTLALAPSRTLRAAELRRAPRPDAAVVIHYGPVGAGARASSLPAGLALSCYASTAADTGSHGAWLFVRVPLSDSPSSSLDRSRFTEGWVRAEDASPVGE